MITKHLRTLIASLLAACTLWACAPPSVDPARLNAPPPEADFIPPPADDPAPQDATPSWQGPLTVATWNVKRFFDLNCDTGRCGRGDYEVLPSVEGFSAKAQRLAQGIEAMNADVVMLQEVESEACLEELQLYLNEPYPVAWLGETGANGSVDVAVLARGQWKRTRGHRQTPLTRPDGSATRFAREFLEVHLDVQGRRVVVFTAHFKSKNNDDPGRRWAEARAAGDIVRSVQRNHPEALVVLGGDLNDTPDSDPLLALEAEGDLQRVASELAPEDWTFLWQGQGQAIDHIYVSLEGPGQYLEGSARILRTDGESGYAGSDHSALMATFVWDTP